MTDDGMKSMLAQSYERTYAQVTGDVVYASIFKC